MRDDIFECNAEDIFAAKNPCQYVQEYCGDALFNSSYLYQLYFCDIRQSNILFSLIAVTDILNSSLILTYLGPFLTDNLLFVSLNIRNIPFSCID